MNLQTRRTRSLLLFAFIFFLTLAAQAFAVSIDITAPQNTTISDTTPDLNFTTSGTANVTYSWDGGGIISGCIECTSFSTTYGENDGSDANLVALWHFNEVKYVTAYDDTSNNNDGKLGNGSGGTAPISKPKGFAHALKFDGIRQFVNVSDSSSLDVTGSLTMAAWVRPEFTSWPIDSPTNYTGVIGKNYTYALGINNGKLRMTLYNSTANHLNTDSPYDVPLNKWVHIAGTFDGSWVKLYINGAEVNSQAVSAWGNSITTTAYPLQIGYYPGQTYFKGIIDDVAIYDRSLSDAEIQEMYGKVLPEGLNNVNVYADDSNGTLNSTTKYFTVRLPVHNIDTELNYSTIQEAIYAENVNSTTIQVDAGTYIENVDVNASVNLIGAGVNTLVKPSDANSPVFNIRADAVTISGLRIAWAENHAGVYIDGASNVTISDNILRKNRVGIYLRGSNSNIISNNNVSQNTGDGIYITSSSYNNITNNIADSNGLGGISLWNSSTYNTISNNTANSNIVYDGIYLNSSNNNNITNNIANSNSNTGITLVISDNNIITNNTASSNDWGGIHLNSSNNNNITNNTATFNTENGIYLRNSKDNTISGNNASSNLNFNGIALNENSDNTLVENNILNSNKNNGIWSRNSSNHKIINNTAKYNGGSGYQNSGIHLNLSNNNDITNNTFYGNYWDFNSINSFSNTITSNQFNNTRASFTYSGDISVNSSSPPAGGTPISWTGIGKYLNVTNTGAAGVFLNISYADVNLGETIDDTLRMYRHNGTGWEIVNMTNNVSLSDKYVYANATEFGVFAPLGNDNTIPRIEYNPNTTEAGNYSQNWIFVNVSVDDSNLDTVTLELKRGVSNNYTNWEDSDGTNYWRNIIGLDPETYEIKVYANDSAGNVNFTSTRTITLDTAPPTIAITLPENTTYGSTSVDLNVSADETIDTWWYEYDGNGTNITFTPNTTLYAGGGDGPKSIVVYANDSAGNLNSSIQYFTVDTTPPNVTIDVPANTTYANPTIQINVTAWDNIEGSANTLNVTAELDGVENRSLTNSSGNWNRQWPGISEGSHSITIYANDSLGNMNDTEAVYFTIDTTPPTITIVSPLNASTTNTTPLLNATFDGTVNYTWYSVDGGTNSTPVNSTQNLLDTLPTLGEGPHNVTVYANDSVNNLAMETKYFTVDTTPPNVTIDSPTNITYATSDIWINVTAWDNIEGSTPTLNVTAELDGTQDRSLLNASGKWYYEWSNISDGPHNITIHANDSAGNMNDTEVVYFTVDTTPPGITIYSPQNQTITSNAPDLNSTISDTANVTHSWDGEGNISGCRECNSSNTTYGEYANSSEQNLSAIWHFNENSGSTAFDDSGSNDALLGNGTTGQEPNWTAGRFGRGLKFDGTNDYVSIPYDSTLDVLDGNKPFTLGMWFKLDKLPSDASMNAALFSQADGSVSLSGKSWLTIDKSGDGGYAANEPYSYIGGTVAGSNVVVTVDTWYFVAVTYNGTHSTVYINGTAGDTVQVTADQGANGEYHIGVNKGANNAWFNGTIDEVLLFDRNLSATEIADLYNRTLTDGQYNVTVYATDTVGNLNSTTRHFTVDTTPPIITVNSPQNNKTYGAKNIDYKITVNEPLNWSKVSINGTANMVMVNSSQCTSQCVYSNLSGDHPDLPEGTHNATFYVQDLMGYTNQTTVSFTINYSKPNINIASPENTNYSNGNMSYNMTITNGVNLTGARVEVNGSNYALINSSGSPEDWYNITVGELEEGYYNATFYADSIGLNSTEIVYFTVDTTPPYNINLNSPQSNSNISSPNITFNWTSYDSISTQLWSNLTINGSVNASNVSTINETPKTFLVTGLSDGIYNWNVITWDPANNSDSSVTYFFTVDTIPPTVSFITPDASATVGGIIYVNITAIDADDANTGVYNVSISTGGNWFEMNQSGGNISESNWSYLWNSSTIAYDNVVLRINATDYAGASSITTRNVTVDNTPPIITIILPENTSYGNTSLDLKISADETIDTWWYEYDGNGTNITFTPNTTLYAGGSDGLKRLVVYANDSLGNLNSSIQYFTVDTTPPNVTIDVPANTTYANPTIQINVTAWDNIEGSANTLNVTAELDGVENRSLTNSSGNWNRQWPGISEGPHSITIYANDSLGNMNDTEAVYFTIDTTLPVYSNLTPLNNSYTSDTSQNISIVIVDEGSDVNAGSLSMNVSGNYYDTNSGKLDYDVNSGLLTYYADEGEFNGGQAVYVVVNGEDNVGNQMNVAWSFTVDTTPPAITVDSPLDETIADNTPDLNFTTNETANVTYSWDGKGNISGCRNCNSFNTTYGESKKDVNSSGLWHFNENSDSALIDDSAQNNHGTISGATLTQGKFGSGLYFDGINDFVEVPDNDNLDFNVNDSFTIGVWIKTSALSGSIIRKHSGGTSPGWYLILSTNKVYFTIRPPVEGPDLSLWSDIDVNDDSWHYVAVVQDGTDNVAKLYVDGLINDTQSNPLTSLSNNSLDMYIGSRQGTGSFLNGTIDDLHIIRRALSEIEIAAEYNNVLEDGSHNVTVWAEDVNAGNLNYATVYFTVDTTLPVYSNLTPPNNSYTSDTSQNISIVIIDGGSDVNVWALSMNVSGNYYDTNSGKLDYDVISGLLTYYADDGEFNGGQAVYVVVNGEDNVGNQLEVAWSFTVDTAPPNVTIDSPTNITYTISDIWINVTVWDSIEGSANTLNVTAEFDGAENRSLTNSSGNWNYQWINISEGPHNITIYASDSAGNMNDTGVVYFAVDTIPPAWVEVPQDQVVELGTGFTYGVNANDTVGVDTYVIDDTENFAIGASDGVITNNTVLNFGNYFLNISVNDTSGNVLSVVITITVQDTILPAITLIAPSPADGVTLSSGTRTVTINMSIVEFNPDTLIINWNSNNASYGSYTSSYRSITGPPDWSFSDGNTYTYYVWVNDTSGNSAQTETRTFSVRSSTDGTSPGPNGGPSPISTPAPQVTVKKGVAVITFSSIDVGSPAAFTVPDTEDVYLTRLLLAVKKKVTNVRLTVSTLDTRPAAIGNDVGGIVYKYLDIVHENVDNEDISIVILTFKVEKSWIDDNGIDPDSITLNRYSEGTWTPLTTTRLSCDSDYCYHEVGSPGLSVFSISGSVVTAAPTAQNPTTRSSPTSTPTVTGSIPASPMTPAPIDRPRSKLLFFKEGKPFTKTVIMVVIFLVILIGAYMYYRHRRREGKWWDDRIKSTEDEANWAVLEEGPRE